MKKVLVTGTAGFIGFHLAERLLKDGYEVVGLDVINDYYDPQLKFKRLEEHGIPTEGLLSVSCNPTEKKQTSTTWGQLLKSSVFPAYQFVQADLADHDFMVDFMVEQQFDFVVHLAAQAGVRYSLENPRAYTHSNIDGFLSILEGARNSQVKHLIYASTSSVYGLNTSMPLDEEQPTEHPMALYAATKKANEMMAHSYSHLYRIPTTGLRFFTVYGPWGRPDMALFLFADAMLKGLPIKVFNHGKMVRDFTFVGDIVESITRLLPKAAQPNPLWNGQQPNISSSSAPYQIFNIGNSDPIPLERYIQALEKSLGVVALKEYLDIQPGDVPATHANTQRLEDYVCFRPSTHVDEGVARFVEWYTTYRRVG
jgi:UDP-glucuronate 4-epimerase